MQNPLHKEPCNIKRAYYPYSIQNTERTYGDAGVPQEHCGMISRRDQFYAFGCSLLGTMFACWIYFPGCAPLY